MSKTAREAYLNGYIATGTDRFGTIGKFDHTCPNMGTGPNTTKAKCIERQQQGGGCHNTRCKIGLETSGYAPPVKKVRPPRIRKSKAVMPGLCACGKVAVSKGQMRLARIDGVLCRECLDTKRAELKPLRQQEQREHRKAVRAERRMAKKRARLEQKLAEIKENLNQL